jgi:hypothetical protein
MERESGALRATLYSRNKDDLGVASTDSEKRVKIELT